MHCSVYYRRLRLGLEKCTFAEDFDERQTSPHRKSTRCYLGEETPFYSQGAFFSTNSLAQVMFAEVKGIYLVNFNFLIYRFVLKASMRCCVFMKFCVFVDLSYIIFLNVTFRFAFFTVYFIQRSQK